MREIKFRIWDRKNKQWKTCRNGGRMSGLSLDWKGIFSIRREGFEVINLFTDLNDKNGKEIYEGDRLKCEGLYVTVVWENGVFCFIDEDGRDIDFGTEVAVSQNWEIIGNIYEVSG